MLTFACYQRQPYYPPEETASPTEVDTDTVTDTDTGPTEPVMAWDDPDWWTEPGPFAPMLDLKNAPNGPHWETWISTSEDLKTWTKGRPFLFNYSSLDLLVLEGKGVILGGSLTPIPELGVEPMFEHAFIFQSTDLVNWGSHMIPIQDAATEMIIDPSMHWTPDGRLQLLYFGSDSNVADDKLPDDYPNPHAIYNAFWDGTQFVQEQQEPLLEADHVVDPSGCYHDGQHYILGTRAYDSLYVTHRSEDDPDGEYVDFLDSPWGAVQVPYCYTQGEYPAFIAQYGGGYGPPWIRWMDKEGKLSDPEPMFDMEDIGYLGCTSPVLGYYEGTYFMIASSWVE